MCFPGDGVSSCFHLVPGMMCTMTPAEACMFGPLLAFSWSFVILNDIRETVSRPF